VAERREPAGGNDFLRRFGRVDARRNDPQYSAIQQPADDAILSFGDSRERCQAEIQRRGANQRRSVDGHGAMFEIDPNGVMP